MENQKDIISRKWKKEYTVVLLANFIYIIIFYFLMQTFS